MYDKPTLTPTKWQPCTGCSGTGIIRHWTGHYDIGCPYCSGAGEIPIYPFHKHEWHLVKHITPTYHIYRCGMCGKREKVDSSG